MLQRITIATYGCPSQAVEYYHALKQHMETSTGLTIDLLYDTDRMGPSVERGDHKVIDAAFVSSRYGMELRESQSKPAPYSVLPVGPITQHPLDPRISAVGYYSVLVVRADRGDANVKSFLDLRGSKLAYSSQCSLSGVTALLTKLRQSGENASFFSSKHNCGSHLDCLDALVNQELEVTVVDHLALMTYIKLHPRLEDKLQPLYAWGPHPPHPFIVNDSLSVEIRDLLTQSLLQLREGSSSGGGDVNTKFLLSELKTHGVLGFAAPNPDLIITAQSMIDDCKKLSINVTYY